MATSEHIRPKEHCARRRQQRPRTLQRQKSPAISPDSKHTHPDSARCSHPKSEHRQKTLTRATDRWTLQKSLEHRQVHALAKTLGSTAHHNGRVAVQHIGNKHGLVNQHAATKGLRIVVHANGQSRIVGTADQAHTKASSTINICLFRHQNVPPKSQHDANCNDRLARTDEAARTYRATVATRRVRGHN